MIRCRDRSSSVRSIRRSSCEGDSISPSRRYLRRCRSSCLRKSIALQEEMGWNVEALPDDLMHNVMMRVPMDALVRCAVVCKRWYASIKCARFCSSITSLHPPPPLLYVWGLCETHNEFALIYNPFSNRWHELFKSQKRPLRKRSRQPLSSSSLSLKALSTCPIVPQPFATHKAVHLHCRQSFACDCTDDKKNFYSINTCFLKGKGLKENSTDQTCVLKTSTTDMHFYHTYCPWKIFRSSTCQYLASENILVLAVLETERRSIRQPFFSTFIISDTGHRFSSKFLVYNSQTNIWRILPSLPHDLQPAKLSEGILSSAWVGRRVYIMHTLLMFIAYFDVDSESWSPVQTLTGLQNKPTANAHIVSNDNGLNLLSNFVSYLDLYKVEESNMSCVHITRIMEMVCPRATTIYCGLGQQVFILDPIFLSRLIVINQNSRHKQSVPLPSRLKIENIFNSGGCMLVRRLALRCCAMSSLPSNLLKLEFNHEGCN
ncbi:hypothetical protein KP509_1Z086700 [Ceratopteris richardii]|nr:hypothetical protein KP509_1Z086700 [Ceratopteris richardii]